MRRHGKVLGTLAPALPAGKPSWQLTTWRSAAIDAKSGHSRFHLALQISYPRMGSPGGSVEIHGFRKPSPGSEASGAREPDRGVHRSDQLPD